MNFAINANKNGFYNLVITNLNSKNKLNFLSEFPVNVVSVVLFSSNSGSQKDYYKILGVPRSSSAEQIKESFYKLSKKYHPDMNPDNKEKASKSFHEVSEAYEILGSKEKRRAYDSLTAEMPSKTFTARHQQRTKTGERRQRQWEKDWSDLDIDYKDFEHFQNLSRRKRNFHSTATNTSENFWAAQQEASYNYRKLQFQERKRREEHPTPAFEKLMMETEKREFESRKDRIRLYLGVISALGVFLFCTFGSTGMARAYR
ncbi:J domain-containing protein [Meloidogyne graminicola]|uniref:J domain-containing protein n=1 Tax=Meloidogyne graminicola TaxID=189291 RepID=A0A8S9ZGF0_9BILA|nr:J domain-containing protein [Meloidogyne graminicola]